MKKNSILNSGRKFLFSTLLLLGVLRVSAQVSGTKTIGTDYATLAAAVADLNSDGITGVVTINVPAGYTETAPAGGYMLGSAALNASTSAGNTLLIQKTGAGANPLLTANTGSSTTVDGIFTILGTDYVTINGIDLTESALNNTATTMMEWGYGLVKRQNTAPFDGCQNVTIQNCTITLNLGNTTSVGIYSGNHIATATTALTITTATDAMNNCRFYSNTIQNCNTGISLRGYAAATPYTLYDQGNDIGGSSAATANTIRNFAGGSAGSGVNLRYQNNANVAYNNINNVAGGGAGATNTLYGVYAQNGTNASVNITNNIIDLGQGTTSSAMYGVNISFSGTGTIDINNNTFTASGGSSGAMYMIYISSGNTTINTNNNNFANINVATTGNLYLIDHSSSSTTTYITCNNNFTSGTSVPYVNKTGAGGTVAAYWSNSSSSGGFATINNNNFSNISLAGNPTFYGIDETNGGSGQIKFVTNNIVSNITAAGGTLYGIRVGFAASENIASNRVSAINAGTGALYGIYVASGTTDTVMNNSVHDLTTSGDVYGVYVNGGTTINIYQDTLFAISSTSATNGVAYGIWQGSGTTLNFYRNKIYDISAAGTGSSVNGIYTNSGTVTIYNNLLGNLRTPNLNSSTSTQLVGMYLGAGTAYNLYYNTVFMDAGSTGANFGSCGVYANTSAAVTLRNNIIVDTANANGSGVTVAYRRSSATLTSYQAASDNNLFYAGVPSGSKHIFFDGTTFYSTLATYKAFVAPRDANSVTEAPVFLSLTGASADFLHLNPAVATQAESGGVNIAGITTDVDGNIRAGNPGYAGTGSAPDIGADEGAFISNDLTAPNITYTSLSNGCITGDRTFTVTITDASGVPTAGALVPRVYFTKTGGAPWFSTPGVLTSGTATNGTWTFTISAAAMGGLIIGDNISYFVIAQDVVPAANLGSNPFTGLAATDVNTITSYPVPPNMYTVIATLSGTYSVGTGMAYPTLTAAVSAYNNSCISGPVVFQLTDALYSAAETFPITIAANVASGAGNTLTIRPAAGVSPVITGSSASAIIVIDGADYVTIDGSNNPVANTICPRVSSSRDMTIENTNTGTSSAVVWLQTSAGGDGATNNTIRNTNIKGSGNARTLFGIGSGGTAISYTSSGNGNNNNRIENDSIYATQTGIFSRGASATNKNTGTVINQNLMNAAAPDNLRNNGIFTGFEDNITISGNYLANISNGASNDIIGINLGFGNNASNNTLTTGSDVTNATVTYNKLDNITQTNTWSALGIAVAGVTTGINTIANNMISGVLAKGTASDFSSGIFIGGGIGSITNVFYNSVNITGSFTGGSQPTYAFSATGTDPVINLKNNIFVNSGNPGNVGLIQAIGFSSSTFANIASDNNDLYSTGTYIGSTGALGAAGTDHATLAAWQTATGDDANSKNIDPVFVSPTDLHVTAVGANIPLMNTGTPVSVVTDYDCAVRNATTPDIGLNEFNVPICSSVAAGTISAAAPSFCGVGTTTVTVTGTTSALGISYQWQSSTDSVNWTAISGATGNAYVIAPAITTTTYYRFVVTCSYSGVSDSVTTKITVNPLPVIAVTPDGGSYCGGSGSSISMTASGALTYSWTPATGLSATTGATVTASPSATTAYVVTGTDAFGCQGLHTSTVTVTATPPPVVVTPPSDSVCSGGSVLLAANANLPATIFADSFNGATLAWTIDNTGSTNTAGIPNTQWQFRPDGYVYGTATFHSPDVSQFAMTNADVGGSGSTTHSILTSPSFSLAGYTAATLTFDHYYRYRAGDIVKLEISIDGGATWTLLNNYSSAAANVGGAAAFASASFSLAPYLGNNNCKVRFDYQSPWGWYWLVDNFVITGSGAYTNITWSPSAGLYNDAALTSPYTGAVTDTVYAAPVATTTPVTTTYTATATNGACSSTGTSAITATVLPDAGTISGPANVCPGASIALTDAALGGVWTSTTGNAIVSATGIVTGVSSGTDTIKYTVTNSCGTAVATAVVTIDLAPNAGTISGPAAVCGSGSVISLTSTVSGGVWSSSNTALATVSATGDVTGVSTGAVTISYTVSNVCGSATATYAVAVDSVSSAGTIGGPASVCGGDSIVLVTSVAGGVWSSSNTSGATVSATGTVTGLSPGTVIITYSVANACGAATALYPVVVNPTPVAYTVTGGGAFCAGSGGVHVGLSGSDVNVSYNLYVGSTLLGSYMGSGYVFDFGLITTPGIYTVTASSLSGCNNIMTGSATVSVNPVIPPTVNIVSTPGDTVCIGTSVTFQAISTNEGTTPSYLWTVNGAAVGTGNNYTYTPSDGDIVSVLLTSSSCASPDTARSTTVMSVISFATPSISISASAGTTVCAGGSATFTATTAFGGPNPVIIWTVNGVNMGGGATFTYAPYEGDIVSATLVSSFPCRNTDSVFSNNLVMHTSTLLLPTVTITASPGTLITIGQYDTLTAVVLNGGPSPTYQWAVNNTIIPGATGPVYISNTFANGDSVSVIVTSSGACGGIQTFNSIRIHVGNVGVSQPSQLKGNITLAPNPNKGTFSVKGTLANKQDADVYLEVIDMLGQIVYRKEVTAKNGQVDEPVVLGSNLANGMYTLSVRTGTEREVFHFVVSQ